MWERIKRIFRSFIGWFVELGEDPELILKQNIRDLKAQEPQINENLAMVKAQVTLAEKALKKLEDRDRDLTNKIKAALKNDRRDIALTFAKTLEEVRREKIDQEGQVKLAQMAFEKAQKVKKAFMKQMEAKIQEANKALSAKRQAEWQDKVANAMQSFQVGGIDATHDEMLEKIERDAAKAEAKLEMAMESAGAGADDIDFEEEARSLQANETLRQFELEMGMSPDISAPPSAEGAAQEKTIGGRETA